LAAGGKSLFPPGFMLFPGFCQENLLMPSKGFGLFLLLASNSNDQNLNDQNKNDNSKQFGAFVLNFEHLNFDIVSDFVRISIFMLHNFGFISLILVAFGTVKENQNTCEERPLFPNQKGAEACKDANVMVGCRTRLDFSLFMGYCVIVTGVTVMEVAINEIL
jgi:hypothetical protein